MPVISHLLRLRDIVSSKPVLKLPEARSVFTLDSSGVAGFFGGDGAVCAMATVHLLPFRAWVGWYNSPGSYEIAKQYGRLADSPFWDGLFPGSKCDAADLFELDGKDGPRRFLGVHSGTSLKSTGHLAYLLSRWIQDIPSTPVANWATPSTSTYVTVISLRDTPSEETPAPVHQAAREARLLRFSWLLAFVPIVVSVTACVLCALVADWWCFSSILLGIVAGGVACLVIGSGKLIFHHPRSASPAPPGDGILWGNKSELVVLLGPENAVNVFTRGHFSLDFGGRPEEGYKHGRIGWCSILLTFQFLVQLLFIPQGTLFGQLMFVTSLGVSWMYNMVVSSFDRDKLQMRLVFHLMPQLLRSESVRRYQLPSWRTAVVLAALFLRDRDYAHARVPVPNPSKPLDKLLPNDTPVWQEWKKHVLRTCFEEEPDEDEEKMAEFSPQDKELFGQLVHDARIVVKEYPGWYKTIDDAVTSSTPRSATAAAAAVVGAQHRGSR